MFDETPNRDSASNMGGSGSVLSFSHMFNSLRLVLLVCRIGMASNIWGVNNIKCLIVSLFNGVLLSLEITSAVIQIYPVWRSPYYILI